MPSELQQEVVSLVEQTKRRSGWPAGKTLEVLEISRSTYQRCLQSAPRPSASPRSGPDNLYALLPSERQAVIDYALAHPQVRHRELAWKMLDAGICAVSSSSVYRVLRESEVFHVNGSGRICKAILISPAPTTA